MKIVQIESWLNERISDGKFIKSSVILMNFFKDPSDKEIIADLKKRLTVFIMDPSYGNIRIFDKDKNHLFSSNIEMADISSSVIPLIDIAIESDSVIYSDFFFCEFHKRIHQELIIPVKEEGRVFGFVLIDVLPEVYFYPLIQSYPLTDKTSEVLLVRQEGDSVLFLNELRHQKETALKLKIPLSSREVPAVKAILGDTGIVHGKDYRGADVLAYIRSVPLTNWYMIAKTDISEIYSSFEYKILIASLLILFTFIMSLGIMVLYWFNKRRDLLIKEIESQKKLRIIGDYLHTIIDTAPVAIYDLHTDGRVKSLWNRSAEKTFGFKKEDVIGRHLPIVPKDKESEFTELRERILRGNPFSGLEIERINSNGENLFINLSTAATFDSKHNPDGIIAVAQDVTEKKKRDEELEQKNIALQKAVTQLEISNEELQTSEEELIAAEEELRTQIEELERTQRSLLESEDKFRIALKNANITVFTHNENLEYTWIYNPYEGLTKEMILEKKDCDFMSPPEAGKIVAIKERVLRTGVSEQAQLELIIGGRKGYFNYNVEPIFDKNKKAVGLICAAMDITDKKAVEEELFQAYKMEAVGQLAGGIAHDFNNMLAGIMGSAEMLQYKLAGDDSLLIYVFNILKASEHAARLTSQLLSFARKGQYQKIPLSIHRVISDVVSMIESTFDRRILIEQKLAANPHTVLGDPTQIQNAILNLMINARDAIAGGSGKIIVSTEIANINKEYSEKYRKDVHPGQFILISVADNGMGMTEEVKKHLFEPFFTTKEIGKGTGLGLASVYGIVKKHNGIIEVDSEAGRGTTMKIYLPLSILDIVEQEEVYPLGTFNGMGMEVLVIDDEELIRKTSEEILTKFGFKVILAKNGREALDIFKEKSSSIHAVILDMIMPEMDGKETFIELKKINKEVKVLLSTGYSADEEANKMIELGINGFIQKPFKSVDLIRKLHEILR